MEQDINKIIWERLRQDNEIRLKDAMQLMQADNGHGYYEMAERFRNGWGVPKKI